jgi:catechol 1,2-dioxygenase
VQFDVIQATLADFVRHDEPNHTASDVAEPWYSLDHTYALERGSRVLPLPPIK